MVSSRHVLLACLLTALLLVPGGSASGASLRSGAPPAPALAAGPSAAAALPVHLSTKVPSVVSSRTLAPSAVSPQAIAPPPGALAASPVVLAGWEGLHGASGGPVPPDPILSVSSGYVVEMVNLEMAVYDKQGGLLADESLSAFFKSGTDFISDPKVQYDAASGRWYASVTDVTATQVLLAVSLSTDPAALWRRYSVPGSATGNCLDQPILGVGPTTVIVSVNVFTQTSPASCTAPFLGAEYWVINKSDLDAGAAAPAMHDSGLNPLEFSIHPAQIEGSSADHYMVATYWPGTATTSNTLHLFAVAGTPPGTVTVTVTNLSMLTAAVPPAADQLGTRNKLDSGDIRVADAVWSSGKLWLGFDEACQGDASRACIRLVEIDTAGGSVLQDFDLDVSGQHIFYPGLRMDGAGDLAVVFGFSSSSDYPGIMTSGRLANDPSGMMLPAEIVEAGSGPELGFCSKAVCRYGDYFGAALDPADASVVWLVGERGTSIAWSTRVFSVNVKAELSFTYSVVGGGSGYAPPVVDYVLSGVATSSPLGSGTTILSVDPGTEWTISPSLGGSSTAHGEIWTLNATTPTSGWANTSFSPPMAFVYYHQYAVNLTFHVVGGSGYTGAPRVAATVFGVGVSLPAPTAAFLDAGSTYNYPALLGGSSSTERWMAAASANGSVTRAGAVYVAYYHQVLMTFQYTVQGMTPSGIPEVHFASLGVPTSRALNATAWADVQAAYAYDPALAGASQGVRWGTGANGNGTVTTSQTISVLYREQFLVSVTTDPGSLASAVTGAGWYDAGSTATLGIAAPAGWRFASWSGDASGSASTLTLSVQRPLNITATFDAGLTITASGGGSVTYAYGSTSGTVPAGSSVTLFVPVGTSVTLTAAAGSWYGSFGGWSGAASGTSAATTVQVNGPGTAVASFGVSLLVVGGVGGLVVVVLLALVALVVARRRRRPPA